MAIYELFIFKIVMHPFLNETLSCSGVYEGSELPLVKSYLYYCVADYLVDTQVFFAW